MPDWIDDDDVFEAEVRQVMLAAGTTPEITGYESLAQIARGGQGVVYRARQASTNRVVAVKVLLDRADASPIDRRRFEREIDLVASLRHPNIVEVYDSGLTGDGRPFLVMEYVDGDSIDAALEGRSVRDVVSAFVDVCQAVNHAHQRGVIHRDLKPSNMRIDADGRPRVLDFGLARTAHLPTDTLVSTSGHFIGSLAWASPEQAAGHVGDIDVRSDVYSLGVVLYQLLTGRLPYEVTGDLREALSAIAEAEPDRPSRVRAEIDADLSTIVLRCLSKDPGRRYQTAGEVAADLNRWRDGEPILARRDSTLYALRKRMIRHRVATSAAVIVLIVLAASLVVVNRARREAVQQRNDAVDARAVEAAMTSFIEDAFTAMDPYEAGARDRRVRTVMDIAAADVATRFADQPRTRMGVERLLGMIYWNLGELENAATHLRTSMSLSEVEHGPDAIETLDLVNSLGAVLMDLEAFDESRALLDRAEAGVERAMGRDNETYISIRSNQAYLLHYEGRLEESDAIYREVLDLERRVLEPDNPLIPQTENNYSALLVDLGRADEAIEMARRVVETREQMLGRDHPQTLVSRMNYAGYLSGQGRVQEAEALERELIESLTRVLGPRHAWTLNARSNLAYTLEMLGREEESVELYRSLIPMLIEEEGESGESVILALNNMAGVLARLGTSESRAEAEAAYRRVIDVFGARYGDLDFRTVIALGNLGVVLLDLKRFDEAEPVLVDAASRAVEVFGPTHPRTLGARSSIGYMYMERGMPVEALAVYEPLVQDSIEVLGDDHWITAVFKLGLGRALTSLERPDEALVELLDARQALLATLGPESPHTKKSELYLSVLRDDFDMPVPD